MVKDGDTEWLTPKEAAEYLGISTSRLYHIKNRLTHWKGTRLLFDRNKILNDYMTSP